MVNEQPAQDVAPTPLAQPPDHEAEPYLLPPLNTAAPNPNQGWIAGLVALGLVYVLPVTVGLLVEFNGPVRRDTAVALTILLSASRIVGYVIALVVVIKSKSIFARICGWVALVPLIFAVVIGGLSLLLYLLGT